MDSLEICYNQSKKFSNTIMDDVISILDQKSIQYSSRSSGSEIIINSNMLDGKSIISILNDNLTIPKDIISLLLDVVEVSDNIYIRQKTK